MAVLKKNQVNQILFTMVDKTDHVTLETSLASNFTIKRVGVNHGSAAANISTLSRAPSKVGSGLYRLSLEANATNYDYVALRIAHASALTQILVYEMRTYDDTDTYSQLSDVGSNVLSYLAGMSNILSAVYVDTADISNVLSNVHADLADLSGIVSDFYSDFGSRVPKEVVSKSLMSDYHSDLKSAIGNVSVTLGVSDISDIASAVAAGITTLGPSDISDIASAVWAYGTKEVSLGASDLSDIRSVVLSLSGMLSDAHSAAAQANSRALVAQSSISNIYSLMSDFNSNFDSRVPKEVASKSLLSDVNSDLSSQIDGITVTIGASDVSDIVSALLAGGVATQSKLGAVETSLLDTRSKLVVMSGIQSDIYSLLSDINSNFQSRIPKEVASKSLLSDVNSNLLSYLGGMSGAISDIDSQLNVTASKVDDMENRISDLESLTSDAHSAATKGNSMLLVGQSYLSNIYSLISDIDSNFQSRIPKAVATNSQLSDLASDLKSYLAGISDILSNVHGDIADMSNILSNTHGDLANLSGITSDIYSLLSSRVPKEVISKSLMSDYHSDLKSAIGNVSVTLGVSDISDIASAVAAGITTLGPSDISDIASAVWAYGTREVTLGASDLSDIRSAVLSLSAMLSDTHSAATKANSMLLVNQSSISDIYSLMSDFNSNFDSRVPKEVASKSLLSDVNSNLLSYLAGMSDTISNIHGDLADLSGVVSDFYSDFQSRVPKELASKSLLSDVNSNLLSYLTGISGAISDIDSAVSSQYSDVKSAATAIKAKTDNLKFTVASQVDANTQYINDTALTGDGGATPWGPA